MPKKIKQPKNKPQNNQAQNLNRLLTGIQINIATLQELLFEKNVVTREEFSQKITAIQNLEMKRMMISFSNTGNIKKEIIEWCKSLLIRDVDYKTPVMRTIDFVSFSQNLETNAFSFSGYIEFMGQPDVVPFEYSGNFNVGTQENIPPIWSVIEADGTKISINDYKVQVPKSSEQADPIEEIKE